MQLSHVKRLSAAIAMVIGAGLPCIAGAQTPSPSGLSPKAIASIEQIVQNLSPQTINMLVAQAAQLEHAYAGRGANARQELKQHKAELEGLRTQVCSLLTTC
jgi:hypothetical protein